MSSRRTVRQLVVAVLVGVLVGGGLMAVTPAGAEVSSALATNWKKIWKKEIRPRADKRYYTKKQSDGKYQPKGDYALNGSSYTKAETYSKAEADAKYQPKGNYALNGSSYTKGESDGKYLPKRALITGAWGFGGAAVGGYAIDSMSYGAVLSAVPTIHFINAGAVAPPQCPGTAAAPDAIAGHLCVYATASPSISAPYVFDARADSALVTGQSTAATGYAYGTWAVRPLAYAPAQTTPKSDPQGSLTGTKPGS